MGVKEVLTHNFLKDGFNFSKGRSTGGTTINKDTVVITLPMGTSKVNDLTDPAQKAVIMGAMDANGNTTLEQIAKNTSMPLANIGKAAQVLAAMQYVKLINA